MITATQKRTNLSVYRFGTVGFVDYNPKNTGKTDCRDKIM